MVWTVIGWILLGLLALLVLALVLPTVITVQLDKNGLRVWARLLFVRVKVFPLKPRKPKPVKETKAKKKDETPKEKKEKPKKSFGEQFVFIKRLAKAGIAAMGVFLRHVRINAVQVVAPLHMEDASETALWVGRAQGALGGLRAVLDGRLKVRFKRIQVIPDFAGQMQDAWLFACKVAFNPVIMFKMAFVFLRLFLRKRPYSRAVYKRALAQKRAAQAANAARKNAA